MLKIVDEEKTNKLFGKSPLSEKVTKYFVCHIELKKVLGTLLQNKFKASSSQWI